MLIENELASLRIHRHVIDTNGVVHVQADHVTVQLSRRTWTPVLLQAGFGDLDLAVPWWGGRHLRFRFS